MNAELEALKARIHGDMEGKVYAVTTGRGRKKKAHILKDDVPVCSRNVSGWKRVDGATVEKFYEVCTYCLRRVEA